MKMGKKTDFVDNKLLYQSYLGQVVVLKLQRVCLVAILLLYSLSSALFSYLFLKLVNCVCLLLSCLLSRNDYDHLYGLVS